MTYNTKAYAAPSATERLRPFTLSRREVGAHRAGLAAAGALVWLALGLGAVVSASGAAADPNLYPFGEPSGGPAVKVPSPPGTPTLAPTIATKTTTRLYGADPFEEAVSITQHIWPAALPENAPNLGSRTGREQ